MKKVYSLTCLLCLFVMSGMYGEGIAYPSCYDLVWDTPGKNSSDSMPLGNGEIGANVWVEENGDLLILISKTDSWDDNGQLLKIGRVRIQFTPSLVQTGEKFCQKLHLEDGIIQILSGENVEINLRVDVNNPVIVVDIQSKDEVAVKALLEIWRTQERNYTEDEVEQSSLIQKPEEGIVYPDVVVEAAPFDGLMWYHHNQHSIWIYSMDLQGLGDYKSKFTDPLTNRIFGGTIWGDGFKKVDKFTLESAGKIKEAKLYILAKTLFPSSPEDWIKKVTLDYEKIKSLKQENMFAQHKSWWNDFWQRSWVQVHGDDDGEWVSNVYALQRWVTACGSRSIYPVKFNGSIFTVEWREGEELRSDPDYRRWGGGYWWQNTRLPYWPLLSSGDFDLMKPLWDLYTSVIEISKVRNKVWWNCEGIYMPETIYFWGLHRNRDYGFNRGGLKVGEVTNTYIRWIWSSGLELTMMMLDYYDFTEDNNFLEKILLPYARETIRYFETRFARDENGMLVIHPTQAIETYQKDVTDDTPTVSGLHAVLGRLIALKSDTVSEKERKNWKDLLNSIVPVPIKEENGVKLIQPARLFNPERGNIEDPELYTIFPYRLFMLNKPDIDVAINTYKERKSKEFHGWQQDAIQAAFLGLTDETKKMLISNSKRKHDGSRFPAFWGPNYDWIPDQCHGGNLMSTLQFMLLQWDNGKIYLFPAWDKSWDVDFKLYAPQKTVIHCILEKGTIKLLEVTPDERKNDVIVCLQ